MSGSRIKFVGLLKFSLLFLTIFVCLSSRSANAESLLLLKSEKIHKSSDDSYKLSTLGFDDKGNLTIRKGNLTVVLIYNPPSSENENLINKNTVQMVMNHENPEITGFGVKLSYAF